MADPSWFDEEFYLKSKLNQLQQTQPDAGWTLDSLREALTAYGFTPYSHYSQYGLAERTSPNPLFNAHEYLEAKLRQLEQEFPGQYTSIDQVADAIGNAGMDLWEHFQSFGWKEGVNPSNAFDVEGYLQNKLAQLQESDPDGEWDMQKMMDAFEDAGLDPVTHYHDYGKDEPGVTPVPVPEEKRVPPDPNPVDPEPDPQPEPQPEPAPGPPPAPVPDDPVTFTLTTGTDTFTGKSGNDTFNAPAVGTLQTGDTLNGGAGTDILNIAAGGLAHTAAPTIRNIETINNATLAGATSSTTATLSLANVQGVQQIWTDVSNVTGPGSRTLLRMNYEEATLSTIYGVRGWANNPNENEIDISIYTKNRVADGANTRLKIALEDTQAGDFIHVVARNGGVEHITVDVAKDSSATLGLGGTATSLETVTITGAGHLTLSPLTGSNGNTIGLIDAGKASGDFSWRPAALVESNSSSTTLTFQGGSGNDTFDLSQFAGTKIVSTTLNGGAGNDVLIGAGSDDIIIGGAGNDILWGDSVINGKQYLPASYGNDTLDGGLGANVLILGTQYQDIQLGGQDTVLAGGSNQGNDAIFNFNFGPVTRWDDIRPEGASNIDVNPDDVGADQTFDIVEFFGFENVADFLSQATIKVGQDNSAYENIVETAVGTDITFAGNTFLIGARTVYTGNTDNYELVIEFENGGSLVFANALGRYELFGLLPDAGVTVPAWNDVKTGLDALFGEGNKPSAGLVDLDSALDTDLTLALDLIGFFNAQGNFSFGDTVT